MNKCKVRNLKTGEIHNGVGVIDFIYKRIYILGSNTTGEGQINEIISFDDAELIVEENE